MVLNDDGETEELQLRAHSITAPGGRPLTYSVSYVGDFYRKLNFMAALHKCFSKIGDVCVMGIYF